MSVARGVSVWIFLMRPVYNAAAEQNFQTFAQIKMVRENDDRAATRRERAPGFAERDFGPCQMFENVGENHAIEFRVRDRPDVLKVSELGRESTFARRGNSRGVRVKADNKLSAPDERGGEPTVAATGVQKTIRRGRQ